MRIPFISERQSAKLASSVKRESLSAKELARKKQIMYMNMLLNRQHKDEPRPLKHLIPELNILGLWKWF